jgi:hypothetical protein
LGYTQYFLDAVEQAQRKNQLPIYLNPTNVRVCFLQYSDASGQKTVRLIRGEI